MKIYRFEKLNEERCKAVANKQIYISNPEEFNDLNDSLLSAIYMPPTYGDEYFNNLQSMIEIAYPDNFNYTKSIFSKKVIENLKGYIVEAKSNESDANLQRTFYVKSIQQEILNSVGICCFFSGDIYEQPLLWAHYADNHKGFCVEYELDKTQSKNILPVNYESVQQPLSARELILCPDESLTRILTSKSMHWQYEKEYRLIKLFPFDNNESGKLIDLPSCLKPLQIITGAKLDDKQGLLKGIDIPITQFCKRGR